MNGSRVVRRIGRDAVQIVIVVAAVVTAVFFATRAIPGDAASHALGTRATADNVAALREELGIDRPQVEQFGSFIAQLFRGDLGTSLAQQGRPVADIVFPAMGVTATIVLGAILLSLVIGVPAGLGAALTTMKPADVAARVVALALLASPSFLVGLLLILVFSLGLRVAPAGGWPGDWVESLQYAWLPALALTAYLGPLVFRVVRQSALETAKLSFVEAALSRGVPTTRITWRHILPNSVLPLIALVSLNAAWMISGSVVIEAVFNLPGLGTALDQGINQLDYPVVQIAAGLVAVTVVLCNAFGDVLTSIIDPRIAHQ